MRRYPYQRLLAQLCREGREPSDIANVIQGLGFIPPEISDVRACKVEVKGTDKDEIFNSDEMKIAMNLIRNDEALEYTKGATLLEDHEVVVVLKHKFGVIITEEALGVFRDTMWNLIGMSHMDAVLYFDKSNENETPRDEVPIRDAPSFHEWESGAEVELTPDRVFLELKADAYFNYKKNFRVATPRAQQEARKWGDFLLKLLKEERSAVIARTGVGGGEEREPDDIELMYDDGVDTPPSIDELQQPEADDDDEDGETRT